MSLWYSKILQQTCSVIMPAKGLYKLKVQECLAICDWYSCTRGDVSQYSNGQGFARFPTMVSIVPFNILLYCAVLLKAQ